MRGVEREEGKRGRLTVHEADLVESLASPIAVGVHHLGELGSPEQLYSVSTRSQERWGGRERERTF